MATNHVQTKTATSASATGVGVSLTGVGAGNHFTVFTAGGFEVATAPTSSPSQTVTAVIADTTSGGGEHLRCDYIENTASGAWTVTCHLATANEICGIVSESSSAATSSSKGLTSVASTTAGNSLAAGSITPTAGSIVYTAQIDLGASGLVGTVGSSYTIVSDPASGVGTCWAGPDWGGRAGDAYLANVAASATNPTWTFRDAGVAATVMIVEVLAAAAATGLPGLPTFVLSRPNVLDMARRA